MKLEIGKYYRTRDGQKVGPMRNCIDYYDYEGSVGAFNGSGVSLFGCDLDLIAEWIDEPVTGTLKELNVQVGDVVWTGISATVSPSPVITETVTTHRIVPGVYGIVDLAGVDKDMVQIRLQSTAALKTWFSASELTAAITTLTAVRDALTHNSAK